MGFENQDSTSFAANGPDSFPEQPAKAREATREELQNSLGRVRQSVHDAAQHLTTILNLAELLISDDALDESYRQDVQTILEEAYSLKDLFQSLRQDLL